MAQSYEHYLVVYRNNQKELVFPAIEEILVADRKSGFVIYFKGSYINLFSNELQVRNLISVLPIFPLILLKFLLS